jgi:hypothetical protein
MSKRKHLSRNLAIGIISVLSLSALVPTAAASDILTIDVSAGQYQIVNKGTEQMIEMEGFGYLMVPGKPMLPSKNFLIALPPGSRVVSVEVQGTRAEQLPEDYRIIPTPPILPLADAAHYRELVNELRSEWYDNNQTVYSDDQAYPSVRGKLNSLGTLRKYSYVSVSFYPFSYHPQSGRLVHFHAAQINIRYDVPSPGTAEAQQVEESKWDNLADEKASRLFLNYEAMRGLYQPTGSKPANSAQTHDYVIITTTSLQSAIVASNFLNWKASLGYNVRTVFITDPEIAGQAGGDLAEKIRNFLRYNYIPWGIEYVLLVGDCETIPMRYCFADHWNHSFYPYDPYTYGGETPTDYYYADLSYPDATSWDSDGDGYCGEYTQDNVDFLAEVAVGRIPTSEADRITYTLNKLVTFEQDTGPWKDNALHAGAILFFENQDHSGDPFIDGPRCLDVIETDLMSGWTISHYSEYAGLVSSSYPWGVLSENAFASDWRNGQYGVVNWSGHGWPAGAARTVWVWDDGDGVPETQNPSELSSYIFIGTVTSNLDDDYPSIVFAISCNVGYPEANPIGNLGIDLLTLPGFGSSIGVLSATRGAAVSIADPPTGGGAESMCYEFNRHVINGPSGPERLGDALYNSKFYSHDNFGWDHYYEYKNMFDYNLYGDPALVREGIAQFTCGDCNGDGTVDVGDVVYLVNYLYRSGSAPDPVEAGDVNSDQTVDVGDVVHLVNYLFKGGPPPGEG